MFTQLNFARLLLVVGTIFFMGSVTQTLGHIGVAGNEPHAWYHFFREGTGDIIEGLLILGVFFGPAALRTPSTWKVLLVVMVSIFAPYWIGMPFNSALAAPHALAETVHILQAVLMVAAMFVAKKDFYK